MGFVDPWADSYLQHQIKEQYSAVVRAVLLFGAYTWVMLAPMMEILEGVHVHFLRKVKKL